MTLKHNNIGNSPQVAQKHYLRVLPSHYDQVAKSVALFDKTGDAATASKPVKYDTIPPKMCAAKSVAAYAGNTSHINEAVNKKAVNCSLLQSTANVCKAQNDPNGI